MLALLVGLLLLVACSDSGAPSTAANDASESPTVSEDGDGTKKQPGSSEKQSDRKTVKGDNQPGKRSGNDETTGSPEGGPGADDDEREDDARAASAPYPAAGTYVYTQQGFEEYCQTASCEREALPPTQRVDLRYRSRSASSAVIQSSARVSDTRSTRTTARYTRDGALLTKLIAEFDYQGVHFSNTYEPRPPVESLRFPLSVGEAWSGTWKARTSGDYDIKVAGRDAVAVGHRSVRAFRVETATRFRGEFEGTADIVAWVDPTTKAVVKMIGKLRVSSAFGRLNSDFITTLRSGPGYE